MAVARCFRTAFARLSLIALAGISFAGSFHGQEADGEARVTKVMAESEDSLLFTVSTPRPIFKRGEDLPINYVVTNKGRRTAYLVLEPTPNVLVKDSFKLRVVQPVSGVDDHMPFNYDLITIAPGRSHSGSLRIAAKHYLSNKDYDFSLAEIQVGFSYLFDKSKLSGCKQVIFVRPCLQELYDRSKSLTTGSLLVEIG